MIKIGKYMNCEMLILEKYVNQNSSKNTSRLHLIHFVFKSVIHSLSFFLINLGEANVISDMN